MASNSERSAMAIISLCKQAIDILLNERRFSQVKIEEELKLISNDCDNMRKSWPSKVNNEDFRWMINSINKWYLSIDKLILLETNRTLLLIRIGSIASGDLLSKLNNKERISKIKLLNNLMVKLDDMLDPTGSSFSSSDDADKILTNFYKEIGFKI